MLGKFATILCSALLGAVSLRMRNALIPESPSRALLVEVKQDAARLSIGSLLFLFSTGALLLYFVEKVKAEANSIHRNTIFEILEG